MGATTLTNQQDSSVGVSISDFPKLAVDISRSFFGAGFVLVIGHKAVTCYWFKNINFKI
jgi:hypothetical protein